MPGGAAGMPGGAAGMMPGGAMGFPAGAGMAGGGGGILGMIPGLGGLGRNDVEDNARFIVAVVEVRGAQNNYVRNLEAGLPIAVQHKWGSTHLRAQTLLSRTILLKDGGGKPLETVTDRYTKVEYPKAFATSPPEPDKVLELAGWCLEHGLVSRFVEVMDKLVELDKNLPASVAYAKVKAALKQPPEKNDTAGAWRAKLMEGYKITEKEGYHYALLHSSSAGSAADLEQMLDTLENTFKGFYYWWAWRGIDLPVPRERQLAVVTDKTDDLHRFHRILTSGPMVGDGFFARREGLTVLSSRRLDESYDALEKFSNQFWSKGFVREAVLTGQKGAGVPKGADESIIWDAQMLALLLKAMETEAQRTTVSHDASRQLMYTAGLLPRNVSAPEWFLFGMGSFFETSPQSPWPTIGAPSFYWQPLFKELKGENRLQRTPADTLRMVVTDGYFRSIGPRGEADSLIRKAHDEGLRKARATSWALTYWLAKYKLEELRRYCKELSKLPRDLELDESTLLEAFARAMGAVGPDNKPNAAKLADLANQWFNYMNNTTLDSEELRKQIKSYYKDGQQMIQKQGLPGGVAPGGVPGLPGGVKLPGY
jgi:hypothetical protein